MTDRRRIVGEPPTTGDNGVWLTPQQAVDLIARLKRQLNGDPEPPVDTSQFDQLTEDDGT